MSDLRKKYSDEELLEQLKKHYSKKSHISKKSFKEDRTTCSVGTISLRFGNWTNGLQKAGLNKKDLKKYSDEEILSQLRDHYKRNGKITRKSFNADETVCSVRKVEIALGSWTKAVKKAMADLTKLFETMPEAKPREIRYNNAELIGKYRRLKKTKYKNIKLTMEDFCRITFLNQNQVIKNFETWENFCKLSNNKGV